MNVHGFSSLSADCCSIEGEVVSDFKVCGSVESCRGVGGGRQKSSGPVDEGGERCQKVQECPGGFPPGVPKTKYTFHCD